ncbi:glycoside hydrolase family 16 protein [Wallemia mellicola]|uniref:Glycoside hydrolase family 16 protein n=1 Tax=Wallemia mellicola TaxID=1708541 RepID=A0A4V4MGR6_9BASI|nr:glycoside hydrolase family 16 protein [Wallemia mellicola]
MSEEGDKLEIGMTPSKVRAIMAQHGELGRIYLAPASNSHPKNPRFVEGWVEFKKRKIARKVAELLNAQPIGGKKGDRHREDIWTMKYLGGFKWEMLSEHIALEQASHAAKLRNELSQSKRDQEDYLKRVDKAKKQQAIEERRQAKGLPAKQETKQYEFKQRQVLSQDMKPETNPSINAKRKRAGYDDAAEQQNKLASTSSEEPLVQPQRRSQLFSPPASMSPSVSEKYMNFPDEPYLWKFGPEDDNPEEDDGLHYPEESAKATDKESSGPVWTYRGIMNIGFLAILTAAILMLFAGYPILGYARAAERSKQGGYNIGFINSTGQIAAISGHRGLIDPDTPEEARTRVGYDGKDYELVFSDEFNVDGRTFYPGEDPFWEAGDLHYWGTNNLEWYSPRQVTTEGGALRITLDEVASHDLEYEGGILTSWNKFCFTGGYISASVQLPGSSDVWGLWPAFWTMGNLGRAGYGASLDGMWPYSYDSCDVGTLKNQSLGVYPPESRTNGDWAYDYSVSYLPGQRLSRCTCDDQDHPGPKHEDGTLKGRSAPEIDILEAQVDQSTRMGHLSMSGQFAPFNSFYLYDNTSDLAVLTHPETDEVNGYHGSVFQQSVSGVIRTNQECYQFESGCYDEYGFEYHPGADGDIKWSVSDEVRWSVKAGAIGPDPITEIGQRTIPEEPMYILINQGISNNFGDIDWDELIFPSIMSVDWVRVYQPVGERNVGCDPPDMPTSDYINRHIDAYMNPNLTTWQQYTDELWPLNALEHQNDETCQTALNVAPDNLMGL